MVLKGRSQNRAGEVRLRSAGPRDTPEIHFRYFDEGGGAWEDDLDRVVHGVEFAESLMRRARGVARRLAPTTDEMADLRRSSRGFPGRFIVAAIYTIAEKASDVTLADTAS